MLSIWKSGYSTLVDPEPKSQRRATLPRRISTARKSVWKTAGLILIHVIERVVSVLCILTCNTEKVFPDSCPYILYYGSWLLAKSGPVSFYLFLLLMKPKNSAYIQVGQCFLYRYIKTCDVHTRRHIEICTSECMWSDLPVCEKVLSHESMPQGASSCAFIRTTEGRKRRAMWQWAIMLLFKWVDAPCSWGPNSSTFSVIPGKLLDIVQHAIWKHHTERYTPWG